MLEAIQRSAVQFPSPDAIANAYAVLKRYQAVVDPAFQQAVESARANRPALENRQVLRRRYTPENAGMTSNRESSTSSTRLRSQGSPSCGPGADTSDWSRRSFQLALRSHRDRCHESLLPDFVAVRQVWAARPRPGDTLRYQKFYEWPETNLMSPRSRLPFRHARRGEDGVEFIRYLVERIGDDPQRRERLYTFIHDWEHITTGARNPRL